MRSLKRWTEYFQFLDQLRESGVTNMFGAGPYLQNAFGMPRSEAHAILGAWMRSFDGTTPVKDRARAAREASDASAS